MSIVEEAHGFLQVFSDGSVKRFAPEISPASPDQPISGHRSKDVIIDGSKPISARLFLPEHAALTRSKLPILVYFHGGGFCIGSTTWLGYHHFLGDLSVRSQCIVLSVDYHLAPEHRLPTAYDDCYTALQWLSRQSSSTGAAADADPWLFSHVDLSRVFLSGDSAGGNITHNVAIKTIKKRIPKLEIKGLLPIHPYFGSETRTDAEKENEFGEEVTSNDRFWRLSVPQGTNRDYPGCNFEKQDDVTGNEWKVFPATVVYVAGKDFLKERGIMYAKFLKKKGVARVELFEEEREGHVFHVFEPKKEATRLMQEHMSDFMKTC